MLDKFVFLLWCEQTEILPLVSILLATVLLTGVTVALGWAELGMPLETNLLLECGVTVLRTTVRVLLDVPKSVCNVLLVNTGVTLELGDDSIVAFRMRELISVPVVRVGVSVAVVDNSVVELLNPNVELLCTNEKLLTRVAKLDEISPLVLSTVVEFATLVLDFKVLLVPKEVIKVCDITEGVNKLELNAAELRVRLTVILEVITDLLLLNISVVEVVSRSLLLLMKTLDELTTSDEDLKLLKFNTLLPTSVTKVESETLVVEALNTLLVFGDEVVDEIKIGLLVDGIDLTNKELFGNSLLEVGSKNVELTKTNFVETIVDKVENSCVLETLVEFTRTLELVEDGGTKDEFDAITLLKSVENVELGTMLVTGAVLNDFVLKTGVVVVFTLDLSTPTEVAAVRLSLVPVGENADVTSDDLSTIDVEFTRAVLLAVEGKCEIYIINNDETLKHLKLRRPSIKSCM